MTVSELKEMLSSVPEEEKDREVRCAKCTEGYAIEFDINGYFKSTVGDRNVLILTNINVMPRESNLKCK